MKIRLYIWNNIHEIQNPWIRQNNCMMIWIWHGKLNLQYGWIVQLLDVIDLLLTTISKDKIIEVDVKLELWFLEKTRCQFEVNARKIWSDFIQIQICNCVGKIVMIYVMKYSQYEKNIFLLSAFRTALNYIYSFIIELIFDTRFRSCKVF